jgi:hypothetical protein
MRNFTLITDDHIKDDGTVGSCSAHGRNEKSIQSFVGKPQWKRPFGRTRSRLEDNIRMNLREIGGGGSCGLDSSGSR